MASVTYEQGQAESHRNDFGTSVWICYGKCHYMCHICEVFSSEKGKYFGMLIGRGLMAIINFVRSNAILKEINKNE